MQAAPTNRDAWWNLGRLRLDLGEFRAAVGPLRHALRGWPTHPANSQAWRALVQAAMAAGQNEAASEALLRWLKALSGRPDAAVDLGRGGAAPAAETEAALQVQMLGVVSRAVHFASVITCECRACFTMRGGSIFAEIAHTCHNLRFVHQEWR